MKQKNSSEILAKFDKPLHSHFFGGKWSFILLFGLTSFLLYIFICIAPVATSIFYGFFDADSGNMAAKVFIGYENYKAIFTDPSFWKALSYDGLIILGKIVIILILTVFFSIALTRFGLRHKEVSTYRFILYIPSVLSSVFIVYFWENFFAARTGLFAMMTGNTDTSFLSEYPVQIITFIASWCGIGYFMILMISAINNIPGSMYEAADLDGANKLTQIFRVTLPQVKNQIIFLVVNVISSSLAGNMNLVLPLYGASSSKVLVMGTYVYYYAQAKEQLGYSNAAAVLLMLISFVLCYFLNKKMTQEDK